MHPLVADVYTISLLTSSPIEWADAHYAILENTDAINDTLLQQKQTNFMMQVNTTIAREK